MDDNEAIRAIAANVADLIGVTNKIFDRLDAIEARMAAPAAAKAPAKSAPFSDEPVPQPERVVDSPEHVQIHFSKNKGKTLGELSENSLSWYAAKWEPREKRDGGYWDNDMLLLDAARTLWHTKRGTLKFATGPRVEAGAPTLPAKPATQDNQDEDIPF